MIKIFFSLSDPAVVLSGLLALILITGCGHQTVPVPRGQTHRQLFYHDDCRACHEELQGTQNGNYCLVCHPDYSVNHHPINFPPQDSELLSYDSSDLPLFDFSIKCLTCHEFNGERTERKNPGLLRGGPYADVRQLCIKCHRPEKYDSLNVHDMKESSGRIRKIEGKLVCNFCHSELPFPEVDSRYDIRFRAGASFLCRRCHSGSHGESCEQHNLKRPGMDMRLVMLKNSPEIDGLLPLVPNDMISCSTCHNPHEQGVVANDAAAMGSESALRLRLQRPVLCGNCHEQR